MSLNKISAVIITYNEASNIARCIDSLQQVADEIIVLDSYSSDATETICREKKVTFLQKEWQGYSKSKNFANSQATFDFILSVDADEVLSQELKAAIREIKKDKMSDGYMVNRRTNYCGKWIKYCGWYPDRKLRLWNRYKGSWQGTIHETVQLQPDSEVGLLQGDLLHYSFNSIADHVITANKFSQIAAEEAHLKGRSVNFLIDVLINPLFTFIRKYFFQLGILDGYYGYVICRISAFANFLKYTKIREIDKSESQAHSDQPY
jgi:glycosyltransferase involved in cell wall biosynthesis